MLVKFGSVTLETRRGDIAQVMADAVVNAANNHLWMGGGVAGALKRAGGSEIEREAVAQGPIEVGDAVVTGGGQLHARYVIHAAVMGQDLCTSQDAITKATRSSLVRARELKVASIAFPAFGTGVGGFPPELAAEAMISECRSFALEGSAPSMRSILFVLFSEDIQRVFEKYLNAGN